jgi:hypothetical protein
LAEVELSLLILSTALDGSCGNDSILTLIKIYALAW